MVEDLFWRASATIVALHLAWSLAARLIGIEVDLISVAFESLALVTACRHLWHEIRLQRPKVPRGR
jgi:hypothetical protein